MFVVPKTTWTSGSAKMPAFLRPAEGWSLGKPRQGWMDTSQGYYEGSREGGGELP